MTSVDLLKDEELQEVCAVFRADRIDALIVAPVEPRAHEDVAFVAESLHGDHAVEDKSGAGRGREEVNRGI